MHINCKYLLHFKSSNEIDLEMKTVQIFFLFVLLIAVETYPQDVIAFGIGETGTPTDSLNPTHSTEAIGDESLKVEEKPPAIQPKPLDNDIFSEPAVENNIIISSNDLDWSTTTEDKKRKNQTASMSTETKTASNADLVTEIPDETYKTSPSELSSLLTQATSKPQRFESTTSSSKSETTLKIIESTSKSDATPSNSATTVITMESQGAISTETTSPNTESQIITKLIESSSTPDSVSEKSISTTLEPIQTTLESQRIISTIGSNIISDPTSSPTDTTASSTTAPATTDESQRTTNIAELSPEPAKITQTTKEYRSTATYSELNSTANRAPKVLDITTPNRIHESSSTTIEETQTTKSQSTISTPEPGSPDTAKSQGTTFRPEESSKASATKSTLCICDCLTDTTQRNGGSSMAGNNNESENSERPPCQTTNLPEPKLKVSTSKHDELLIVNNLSRSVKTVESMVDEVETPTENETNRETITSVVSELKNVLDVAAPTERPISEATDLPDAGLTASVAIQVPEVTTSHPVQVSATKSEAVTEPEEPSSSDNQTIRETTTTLVSEVNNELEVTVPTKGPISESTDLLDAGLTASIATQVSEVTTSHPVQTAVAKSEAVTEPEATSSSSENQSNQGTITTLVSEVNNEFEVIVPTKGPISESTDLLDAGLTASVATQVPEVTTSHPAQTAATKSAAVTEPESMTSESVPTSESTSQSEIPQASDINPPASVETAPSRNEATPPIICTEEGNFSNPLNCHVYTVCYGDAENLLPEENDCPERFAFSPVLRRCTRDISPCLDEPICLQSGSIPDPTTSSAYYWCVSSLLGGFHKFHIQCSPEEVFNALFGRCLLKEPTFGPIGTFYGIPNDRAIAKLESKKLKKEIKAKLKEDKNRQKIEAKAKSDSEKLALKQLKKQQKLVKEEDDEDDD